MQVTMTLESPIGIGDSLAKLKTGAAVLLPGTNAIQSRIFVRGPYILGSGTQEDPLRVNIPAMTSAILNSMTSANFIAIRNGIASCDSAGPTGGIGSGDGCASSD